MQYWKSLLGSAFLFVTFNCVAAPIVWSSASGGNDHAYDLVFGTFTWTEARDDAASMSFNGQIGYLATITSQSENDFLIGNFQQNLSVGSSAMFGASDEAVPDEWRWVTGPEAGTLFWLGGPAGTAVGYANWSPIEPNTSGSENFGGMILSKFPGFPSGTHEPGQWGDANNAGDSANTLGYLVEFNAGSPSGVPEPSSFLLFGLGLVGLGFSKGRLH